jgi:hypothetical protein
MARARPLTNSIPVTKHACWCRERIIFRFDHRSTPAFLAGTESDESSQRGELGSIGGMRNCDDSCPRQTIGHGRSHLRGSLASLGQSAICGNGTRVIRPEEGNNCSSRRLTLGLVQKSWSDEPLAKFRQQGHLGSGDCQL